VTLEFVVMEKVAHITLYLRKQIVNVAIERGDDGNYRVRGHTPRMAEFHYEYNNEEDAWRSLPVLVDLIRERVDEENARELDKTRAAQAASTGKKQHRGGAPAEPSGSTESSPS